MAGGIADETRPGGALGQAVARAATQFDDLRALLRTAMNQKLRLDAAEALSESPALLTPRANIPVTTWVGAAERPEFIRHARLLTDAWAGLGTATECVIDPGRHHFDVIDGLTDPASPLMRRLLDHGA
jgi:arylformamidase